MRHRSNERACSDRLVEITTSDLPLACPMQSLAVWEAHPRVYLPIEETGQVLCPYCGTQYILKPFPLDNQK